MSTKLRKTTSAVRLALETGILRDVAAPKHRPLFLPRLLAAEAAAMRNKVVGFDESFAKVLHWADLVESGALNQNETEIDGDFLNCIFGQALGYPSSVEKPEAFNRRKHPPIGGADKPDGALGKFAPNQPDEFFAVIELKSIGTDLDHDKSQGRTPVNQLWDYLNLVPQCPWGILSNYATIRLYHRDRTPRVYEEFRFIDLRDPEAFARFYYVFHRDSILGNRQVKPRTVALLSDSRARQREVGDKLYEHYSNNRQLLIEYLIDQKKYSENDAIAAAQKLIDRVVFIAFCDDRGLLPPETLKKAGMPPASFTSATNPVWQQFKALFGMIDKGNESYGIPPFNGGLFSTNKLVDDLELPDGHPVTKFFVSLDTYDFRDEVNVDVLGNLFEKSITELEKFRAVGLYATGGPATQQDAPQMPKSALRKRFGVYYTPPDFTREIVERTVGATIAERLSNLPTVEAKLAALQTITVCDPACGSGAFLIAAYERFKDAYEDLAKEARIAGNEKLGTEIDARYPDDIVTGNLFGVDLSREAVEITQLSLWLQTARKDKTLANLSRNIVCGNSLVSDSSVHARALCWQTAFPAIFGKGGFDLVIGNPPWERMKLQQREFFALGAPDIASAVSAATRRSLIEKTELQRPDLFARFTKASTDAEKTLAYARSCGRFPLTAQGDVNTYMLFAELARTIVHPDGRVGLLVPSGIATDKTTADFFIDLIDTQTLHTLFDFENKQGHFEDVHRAFKFSILVTGGMNRKSAAADFVFFAHNVAELADPNRHIRLTAKDLKLLNPNTKTCPIFRTTRDCELTKTVYRRVPVLVDRNRSEGGNPWGVRFVTMFHQTNDADHFREAADLARQGFKLEGNQWRSGKRRMLPLYEAKMVQAYDHRAAGVRIEAGNWMRQGQTDDTTLVDHQNPEFVVQPRYWVDSGTVASVGGDGPWTIGYKDVTSSTNQRTMIAAMLPACAAVNSAPLIRSPLPARRQACLLANLNSLALDFVARQKVGGLHLNFFIVEQLPVFPPDAYDERCPWDRKQTLGQWISERVLRLTCTSNDMKPLAQAADFKPGIVKWKEEERAELLAELDAAYFRLYGLNWDDVSYVLTTFQAIRDEDLKAGTEPHPGEGATRTRIHTAWDMLG